MRKRAKSYEEIPTEVHGTYSGYVMGCTCDECKRAKADYNKIYSYAVRLAAKWVRTNRPLVWNHCLEQAYDHFDKQRNPVGKRTVTEKSNTWLRDYNDR